MKPYLSPRDALVYGTLAPSISMHHYIAIIFKILLTVYLPYQSSGQRPGDVDFYNRLKNYDLSSVFNPDSITDDGNKKFNRPDPLGYIGDNYQRFKIHLLSVVKSNSNPYEYKISGKTKVRDNVCSFEGTITVIEATYDTSSLMRDIGFPTFKQGLITGHVKISEDRAQPGSGTIEGKLTTDIYFDDKNKIHYQALMLVADGFCNNQFEGKWTSYKTRKVKKCNWGDFRIPDSRELDFGTGEFSVNPAYEVNGWENYDYGRNEEDWWTEK
jgi:hypothetical protein